MKLTCSLPTDPVCSCCSRFSWYVACALLPLVCDLHDLVAVAQRHASRGLLGRDGALLGVVLDEGDALAAGHQTDLAEAVDAAEDVGQGVDVAVVGQVPARRGSCWAAGTRRARGRPRQPRA